MPPTTTLNPPPPTVRNGPLARFLAHPATWWADLGQHLARIAHAVLPVAATVAVVLAVLVALVVLVRVLARYRSTSTGQLVEVDVPPAVDPRGAVSFWRNLHPVLAARHHLLAAPHSVAFEVTSSANGIGLRIWVPPSLSAHAVARAVSSAWPGSRCRIEPNRPSVLRGRTVTCGELRLASPSWLPLRTDHDADPLRTILGALFTGDESDEGALQVVVAPAGARATRSIGRAARFLHTGRPMALVPRLLAAWQTTPQRPSSPDPMRSADVRHVVQKASDLPSFEIALRYGLSSASTDRHTRRRLRSRAHELTATFGVYAGRNHLIARHSRGCRRRLEHRAITYGQVLGLSEVAALAHLPWDAAIPGLVHASAAMVGPPSGVLAERAGSQNFEEDDDALF
ncbi:MAG TPA: hypothetical protein VMV22_14615 [Acidimicrobiales bacterium]|nr:hypothetical protein [Acidimicrobiales bacterium]